MDNEIPEHERIFHTPEAKASLGRAIEWIKENPVPTPATAADIDALEAEIRASRQ